MRHLDGKFISPSQCGECKQYRMSLIEIGEPLGPDSMTALVCLFCLEKAVRVAKTTLPIHPRSPAPS